MSLRDKSVLVTGGAGSLGSTIVRELLEEQVQAVRVFDSDEHGLYLLKRELEDDRLRFLLGDIKDRERTQFALNGIDVVVHMAALKNIEITEYNVPETIRTNITGTVNLVETALLSQVERFLFVSSDKAVNSPTLYGSTKYVGERTVLWASKISEKSFSCCRMGNFLEARGNVFELWEKQAKEGKPLTITHTEMKRYYMATREAAKFVLKSLDAMRGGEVFVPKMKEYSIFELLKSLYPKARWKEIGVRKQEKLREELLTSEELKSAEEREDMWIIREKSP